MCDKLNEKGNRNNIQKLLFEHYEFKEIAEKFIEKKDKNGLKKQKQNRKG